MFNPDKPLQTSSEDKLSRSLFSKQLAKAILAYKNKDNFVIGLFGAWGSGKTSIINMVIEELAKESDKLYENERPIIFKFEPWNFTGSDNLIPVFFQQLQQEIDHKDSHKIGKDITNALEKFVGVLSLLEKFSLGINPPPILKASGEVILNELKEKYGDVNLEQAKNELISALEKKKGRIIIIIDDIDRLTNEQIRVIFQLVTQVAKLPNITYLLSMDRNVVTRALSEVQNCDGNDYLEKVIQVPFEIPYANQNSVIDIFFSKLNELLDKYEIAEFDKDHFHKIFDLCVKPYINTIRDVNRIINTFQFKYDLMHDEVNFSELLGLTVIEIYNPNLYRWMAANKTLLCDYFGFPNFDNKKLNKDYLDKSFSDAGVINETAYPILCFLFPMVKIKTDSSGGRWDYNGKYLRDLKCIASPDRFELYFQLDPGNIAISDYKIQESLFHMSDKMLGAFIEKINNQGKISFYLDEVSKYFDKIPQERIPVIAGVLLKKQDNFRDATDLQRLRIPAKDKAIHIIDDLLIRIIDMKSRITFLKSFLSTCSVSELPAICSLIHLYELRLGRIDPDKTYSYEIAISDKELDSLEKLFLQRMDSLKDTEQLFDAPSLGFIILLWEKIDEESCKSYFYENLKNPRLLLKYICKTSGTWSGNGGNSGWNINYSQCRKFIGTDVDIKSIIENYDKESLFNDFSSEEQEIIATCYLNEDETNSHFNEVSKTDAQKLIESWRICNNDTE